MSRTLLPAFTTHLDGQILFLANMILVTRLDGQQFGFTGHDQPITFEGVTYEALTSVDATEVRQSAGGGVDNLTIVGLLVSDRITDIDLRAGLYDGASVELFQVNWADLSMGRLLVLTGTIGEISHRTGEYRAEIRSLSQRLSQQIVELTSPTCRVRALGDERCLPPDDPSPPFSLASFQHTRTVGEVVDLKTLTISDDAHAAPYFRYGRAVGLTGANDGLEREIKEHEATVIPSGAADFNAANSESLSRADNAALSHGDFDFTWIVWAKADVLTGDRTIFAKGNSASSSSQEVILWKRVLPGPTDVWRWQVTTAASVIGAVDSLVNVVAGAWNFFAVTHDSVNNLIGLRVNSTTETPVAHSGGVRDSSEPFRVGADENGNYWDGLIGPIRRWNRVLSGAELDAEYNAGLALLYGDIPAGHLTSLIAAWDLDEVSDGSAPVTRVDSHSTNDLTDNNTVASGGGIANITATQIILQEAFPFAVEVGDTFMLEAGCDRTLETCRVKFSNALNYQGEPTIPGVDQIQERGRR